MPDGITEYSGWTDPQNYNSQSTLEHTPLIESQDTGGSLDVNGTHNHQETERTIIVEELSLTRLSLILGTAWFGCFLSVLDSTIIATLSASISSEFKSLSLLSWLATAYLIPSTAVQPISGRLTDIFGRGPGLVFSNICFAAGNFICGLAKDKYVMILGRVIAGIGGGGLMTIAVFLGSDLVPLRKRGLAQGIGSACYGTGAMAGSILGGVLNDHTKVGWRLAFLIQVPAALLSAMAAHIFIKVPAKQSHKSYIARIDFLGAFLLTSFLVLLLLGLNSGGNLVPWTHPLPVTTIPLSIATFVSFIFWETKTSQPILPVKFLSDRAILSAGFSSLLATMILMTGIFYAPLYLQVLGDSASGAGIKVMSSPVGISVGSLGAGYITKRTGSYVRLGAMSSMVLVVGTLLFTIQGQRSTNWMTPVAIFLTGAGFGALSTVTLLACIAAVDHAHQAVVTSAIYLARSLGAVISVTIASAVYQNILKTRLWELLGDQPHAADEIRRIRNDLDELSHLPQGWYVGVMNSYMAAFRGVWLMMCGSATLALMCSLLMKQHELHRTLDRGL